MHVVIVVVVGGSSYVASKVQKISRWSIELQAKVTKYIEYIVSEMFIEKHFRT